MFKLNKYNYFINNNPTINENEMKRVRMKHYTEPRCRIGSRKLTQSFRNAIIREFNDNVTQQHRRITNNHV